MFAKELAIKIDVDIKRPRTCHRQRFRQNAVGDEQSNEEQAVEDYLRINVTIPLVDEVLESMKARFEGGQASAVKGTMLISSICSY